MEIWSLNDIANRITTALILHNIVVADCVMGDINQRYNPAATEENLGDFIPNNTQHVPQTDIDNNDNNDNQTTGNDAEGTENNTVPQSVRDVVAVMGRWESLMDEEEHTRLRNALIDKFNE